MQLLAQGGSPLWAGILDYVFLNSFIPIDLSRPAPRRTVCGKNSVMALARFGSLQNRPGLTSGHCAKALLIVCGAICVAPMAAAAQAQDPTGIKRAFLDRYLDCAEAPGDAARLACYDALLADIPAWLDDPNDPPAGAVPARVDRGDAPSPTCDRKDCDTN
jgi:hypothetical protein